MSPSQLLPISHISYISYISYIGYISYISYIRQLPPQPKNSAVTPRESRRCLLKICLI